MFIIIQIPFVDFRLLDAREQKPFFFPNQFTDRTYKTTYYRHFGSKHYRRDYEPLPLSEHNFFNSEKLLRIRSIPDYSCKLVFSRLFTDDFFFHFDIGLRIKAKDESDEIDLPAILRYLFAEDVFIAAKPYTTDKSYSVFSLRQYIESLYLYATTRTKCLDLIENNHLYFGKTAIFCQCNFNECAVGDIRMTPLDYDDVLIQKATLNYQSHAVHLWLFEKRNLWGETKDLLRRLRICLLKLNAYREGLNGIFQYLSRNDIIVDSLSELLLSKFTLLLDILSRDQYYGVNGRNIMDRIIAKECALYYESWEETKQKLRYFVKRMNSPKKNTIINQGELIMGDQYNAKQAGIQGPQSGTNATVNLYMIHNANDIDFEKMILEVGLLKKYLRECEPNDENDILIGELSKLNQALEQKDENKVITVVKSCGKQLFDIAKRIGCSLIATFLAGELGLK